MKKLEENKLDKGYHETKRTERKKKSDMGISMVSGTVGDIGSFCPTPGSQV